MMIRVSGLCGGARPTREHRIGGGSVALWVTLGIVGFLLVVGLTWFILNDGSFVPDFGVDPNKAGNNFKQVTLAIINNADQNNGNIPSHAIYSKGGKPLLSWRVAILPQLDEGALYKQIRLDEPWDSEHNKQFWAKMPKVFEMPGAKGEPGKTPIQVIVGNETTFPDRSFPQGFPQRFPASITDGPAQTICLVEARDPVNWMEPADVSQWKIDQNNMHARLGNLTGRGTMVSLWDGSVRVLLPNLTYKTLRAAITCSANDVLGADW
jgi:hypothetical protein